MERDEAVSYLKVVLAENKTLSRDAVRLDKEPYDSGFTVRIKGNNFERTVKEIATERHLAVRQEADEMIVYKPN